MSVDVRAAAARIAGRAVRTPLLESDRLNERAGRRVMLKAENLQRAASFKYRGALNTLLSLGEHERARGVIAYSSGNHALALATAARDVGTKSVVVMPDDAPAAKIEGARAAGAEVILYVRGRDDREAICARLAGDRGLTLVPPYDDERVIEGQATVALEAIDQCEALGAAVDAMAVPCSGGGLAAGCAIALAEHAPSARLVTVEPQGFDDMARSLRDGARVSNPAATGSVCDALLVTTPGALTFPILQRQGATGVSVPDAAVSAAVAFALRELRLVLEPGGAAALAAAWAGLLPGGAGAAIVVLSGGNVSEAFLASAVASMRGEGTSHV